jgi:hypothetical protein
MARHPSVEAASRWLDTNPNLPLKQRRIADEFSVLRTKLLNMLGDGPQLVLALHSLTAAKDQAVRQSIEDGEK